MKICKLLIVFAIFFVASLNAQQPVIQVSDNLVVEGIPALPSSLIDESKAYTEARAASFVSWHPLKPYR